MPVAYGIVSERMGLSYVNHQKSVANEVVQHPHLKQDIEFTAEFITSNQKN